MVNQYRPENGQRRAHSPSLSERKRYLSDSERCEFRRLDEEVVAARGVMVEGMEDGAEAVIIIGAPAPAA
jgi:hypothetical protein